MPERKIVPCSRTYLSCREVSGRESLTGAPGCAVVVSSRVSVPAMLLVSSPDRNGSRDLTTGGQQKRGQGTDERPRGLLLPRALELAQVLVHDRVDLDEVA